MNHLCWAHDMLSLWHQNWLQLSCKCKGGCQGSKNSLKPEKYQSNKFTTGEIEVRCSTHKATDTTSR